jgi:uncharacterized protein (TIGR02147 family)
LRVLQVDVFGYLDYRAFLRDAYSDLKVRQKGFSYRWFSRRAGFASPNFLKLVADGKRNLTPETTQRFADALGLSSKEGDFFRDLVGFCQAASAAEKNRYFERIGTYHKHRAVRVLDRNEFEYFSRWYYVAVRELVACRGFREDPEWIARRLVPPITAAQASHAIELLLQLGFVERNAAGRLRQKEPLLSTGPEVRSLAAGNFHRQMMERAAASIERVPRERRDISGLTVALTPDMLVLFKQKVIQLRAELLELSASAIDPTVVTQLNFQLFPLASTEPEEETP